MSNKDVYDIMLDNEEMWYYRSDGCAVQILDPATVYAQMEDC